MIEVLQFFHTATASGKEKADFLAEIDTRRR